MIPMDTPDNTKPRSKNEGRTVEELKAENSKLRELVISLSAIIVKSITNKK